LIKNLFENAEFLCNWSFSFLQIESFLYDVVYKHVVFPLKGGNEYFRIDAKTGVIFTTNVPINQAAPTTLLTIKAGVSPHVVSLTPSMSRLE